MSYLDNLILNTDSYKASHFAQYPPGTEGMFSYIESRGGEWDRTVFFGLQMILKEYLSKPVTDAMVNEARDFFAAHGEPFDEAGWRLIVREHGGLMPVRIRAVPEGSVVPGRNVLVTIESTDARLFWIVSYLETLLMRVWYPITVATQSWHVKAVIRGFLDETSDDAAGQIAFKLHDFGARGVSSTESAAIGGCAHLVNFMGTDTLSGILAARNYYGEPMAAFSIPAAEHSTITAWGRENEVEAYRNMLKQFAKPGSLVAVVSDSYDIYNAVENLWGGALRQEVIDSGATVVIRPDSGNPPEVVLKTAAILDRRFGSTFNAKGYKVLKHVRIIQGDGVNPRSIREILANLKFNGYAADNVAFGMGGALLQHLNRDTLKFAMKCSAVKVNGEWREVFKDPVTDPGKTSKRGRITTWRNRDSGDYRTARLDRGWHDFEPAGAPAGMWEDALQTVWENGRLLKDWTFAEVRARAAALAEAAAADIAG
ncbi:MAG: nicotinate phosphoribosyltransferase [Rhodocyclaceae bacterium]|nr:nicotinate phosphoribosyltransferase [Rhodocyclaceae bacterium]